MTSLRNYVITIYTLSVKAVCILSAALAAVLFSGCSPRVATSFWRIGTPADSTREGYAVLYEGTKMRHCYPITEWKTTDEKEDVYHSLHHHGVAVESEKMAYRIYFDKKQTIDPYCKRKPQLELAQSYWYPNDSLLAAGYGDDILRVSGTVGVGSVKYWNGKKHAHIENIVERSQRIVKQTRNKATIEVAVKGWQVPLNNSQLVNLSVQYTMKAGHRDMRCDVTLSEAVEGLCTGVQTIPAKGGKDTVTIILPNGVLLASWGTDWPVNDSAKYAKETVGLAVFVPKQFAGTPVHDKQNNLCLLNLTGKAGPTAKRSYSDSGPTAKRSEMATCHFYLTCCGATKENHPVARTAEEWYAYLRKWAKGLK
ncbi:MAG: DUF4861 family protein [Paludibacteraceae bacterium]|nr:DUF4861 family protein [Paludibacteraceae bacterium]